MGKDVHSLRYLGCEAVVEEARLLHGTTIGVCGEMGRGIFIASNRGRRYPPPVLSGINRAVKSNKEQTCPPPIRKYLTPKLGTQKFDLILMRQGVSTWNWLVLTVDSTNIP